jgi:hypothetical protein
MPTAMTTIETTAATGTTAVITATLARPRVTGNTNTNTNITTKQPLRIAERVRSPDRHSSALRKHPEYL